MSKEKQEKYNQLRKDVLKMQADFRQEGAEAYERGVPFDANPYSAVAEFTAPGSNWAHGWEKAMELADKGTNDEDVLRTAEFALWSLPKMTVPNPPKQREGWFYANHNPAALEQREEYERFFECHGYRLDDMVHGSRTDNCGHSHYEIRVHLTEVD